MVDAREQQGDGAETTDEERRAQLSQGEELLDQIFDDARGLLGPSPVEGVPLFDQILRRHPEHRLTRLCTDEEETVLSLSREPRPDGSRLFLESAAELDLHFSLLRSAKLELSNWAEVAKSCFDPGYYDHLILTLATLDRMRKTSNFEAQLIPEVEGLQTPDLMAYSNGAAAFAVEVKSKRALFDATGDLNFTQAEKLIKTAISDTGSTTSGQLGSHLPSLLVIAGFGISGRDFEMMQKAALAWLKRHGHKRKGLIGIQLLSLYVRPEQTLQAGTVISSLPELRAKTYIETVRNSWHESSLRLLLPSNSLGPRQYATDYRRWHPTAIVSPAGIPDAAMTQAATERKYTLPKRKGAR